MKKFRFSLETVLEYKQQVLDSLQAEHGAILAQVRQQEELIEELEAEYRHMSGEFSRRKLEGLSILDAIKYEQVLRAMEREIEEARERLRELQKQAEKKRAEEDAAERRIESAKDEESGEAWRLDKTNKVTVTASSWDELRRLIDQVVESDMGGVMISAAERNVGQNFDFSL